MLGGPEFQSETDMSQYKSDLLLRLLDERGYIHQLTDAEGLDALAAKQVVPGYIGFDATAPSLHVGSLVQIMMLRRLQQTGHKPVVLMGGGTTRIGDPTGRDESRKMLSDETIEANIASIRTIFCALSEVRRWPDRCGHGQQPRLAGQAGLYRNAAGRLARISPSTGCWRSIR
jgi:hypothetical protein